MTSPATIAKAFSACRAFNIIYSASARRIMHMKAIDLAHPI
jgi:hypothetical protein